MTETSASALRSPRRKMLPFVISEMRRVDNDPSGTGWKPIPRGFIRWSMMKTLANFQAAYQLPLPDLIFRAAAAHRRHHDVADIQRCALLSIKTGGCAEDCGYCAQSAHFKTGVPSTPLISLDEVREKATRAKELGATRFCMGTAWREPKDGPQFDRILDMVRIV